MRPQPHTNVLPETPTFVLTNPRICASSTCSPLVQTYYSWTLFTANLLFTGAGLCSLVTFFVVAMLSDRVSDSTFTSVSLAFGAAGYALLLGRLSSPPEASRFLVAFCLVSVAFPLGRAGISRCTRRRSPPGLQGAGQGAILRRRRPSPVSSGPSAPSPFSRPTHGASPCSEAPHCCSPPLSQGSASHSELLPVAPLQRRSAKSYVWILAMALCRKHEMGLGLIKKSVIEEAGHGSTALPSIP